MLKHQAEEQEKAAATANLEDDFDFKELEEELRKFHPEGEPRREEDQSLGSLRLEPCAAAEDPSPLLPPLTSPMAPGAGAYLRHHPSRQLRQPAFPEPLVRG